MHSGATAHMTCRLDWLVDYKEYEQPEKFYMGNGTYLKALGTGDVIILAFNGENWERKHLSNVRYIPTIKYNLFSNGSAADKKCKIVENKQGSKVYKGNRIVVVGERHDGLCKLRAKVVVPGKCLAATKGSQTLKSWHERLAI